MQVSELKKAFAEKWLRNPDNSFAAAQELCDGDISRALALSVTLENDPQVKQYKRDLIEQYGEEYFLPSKEQMLQDVLRRAKNCKANDDYVKLMKLAADMRGFIERPGVVINNNQTNTINKVMTVPVYVNTNGSPVNDVQWEQMLISNQERLTDET